MQIFYFNTPLYEELNDDDKFLVISKLNDFCKEKLLEISNKEDGIH